MKYFSEDTVLKIVRDCRNGDNVGTIGNIHDYYEHIDIPDKHGRIIDDSTIELGYDPHFGGRMIATAESIANAPTILETTE